MYSNIIVAPLCAVGLQKRARLGSNVGSRQEAVRRRTTRRAPSHDARRAFRALRARVACVRARVGLLRRVACLGACGSPAHPPAKPAHPPRRVLRGLRIVRWTSPLTVVRGRVARPKITEFLFVAVGPLVHRTNALRSLLAQCSRSLLVPLLVHCSAIPRSLLVHCSWRRCTDPWSPPGAVVSALDRLWAPLYRLLVASGRRCIDS